MSLPGFTADKPLQFQYTGNLRSIAEYEQEYKSVTVQPNQPARERGLYDCIMCGTHIYYCNKDAECGTLTGMAYWTCMGICLNGRGAPEHCINCLPL